MKVLVTGATGFIGSQVVAKCLTEGHDVTCCVRSIKNIKARFPTVHAIPCDFNKDIHPEIWLPRLEDIDIVINCVGILQSFVGQSIEAIHHLAPAALFKACEQAGVKKIIHISALGAAADAPTPYGRTKFAADEVLSNLNLDSVILRPSLVYGTGSYGGTSLFRGMSALPGIVPVVGKGDTAFQPIFIKDLARAVSGFIKNNRTGIFNAMGPDKISMKNMLLRLRRWLGIGKGIIIKSPVFFIQAMARLGDFFPRNPINTTAIKMLLSARTADPAPFAETLDFKLRSFDEVLTTHPAQTQDLWHARLYFIRTLLRFTIGLLWVVTGLLSASFSKTIGMSLLASMGVTGSLASVLLYGGAGVDIILGLLTWMKWRLGFVGSVQIFLIVVYTLIISITMPSYWLHPFGPVLKNIPIIVATLVMMALEKER